MEKLSILISGLLLLFLPISMAAQNVRGQKRNLATQAADTVANVELRGRVLDATGGEPVPGAHASLCDSQGKVVLMAQSDDDGQYLLKGAHPGQYVLKVSCMGFLSQSFRLKVPRKGGFLRLDDASLRENSTMMQEAVVEGHLSEMAVRDDTVMYNADAFKLQDDAMVEDLVEKLPGMVVDEDGNYTWNGKPITQVLVDGKEFFGKNMEMTLKNLPADMIDKVKAYDKQSDMARITGIDDGEERTVLDLTIKKNRKRGWMGNLNAGYGTHDRWKGRAMASRFRGDQKVTLVGNANNTEGNGMASRQSLGLTQNYERKDKLELNGGLTGNLRQADSENSSTIQSFENKLAAYQAQHRWQSSHSGGLRFNYKMEWKPDTMTNIIVRPEFHWSSTRSSSNRLGASMREDPLQQVPGMQDVLDEWEQVPRKIRVNYRKGATHSQQDDMSGSASVQASRRLAKKGRSVTMNLNAGFQRGNSDSQSYSETDYYRLKAVTGEDSIYQKTQFNSADNYSRSTSARLSYIEPVGRQLYLQASYQYSWRRTERDRDVSSIFGLQNRLNGVTLDNYRQMESFSVLDTAQLGRTENVYQNHSLNLQLRMVRTKFNLTIGAMLQPQVNSVDYTKGIKHYDVRRTVVNASPTLNFRYRFSKTEQFNAGYHAQTGQPSITDLIPDTLSNADPLNIRLGNPGLKPSFTQNVHADYRKSITDLQRTYAANIQFRTTQNSVSSRTEYDDQTGGRVTTPQNVNGNWSGSVGLNFNTAFRGDQRFRVNTNTQGSMTNAVGYVYRSRLMQTVKNRTQGVSVHQGVRFTFRTDWLELNAQGGIRYSHSHSSNSSAGKMDTYRYNYGGSAVVHLPWNMTLSTSINEQCRRGYSSAKMNTNELIWGMELSQSLLPRKNLTISLKAVDLLDQRSDISRTITATARTDTYTSSIHSYFLASVNYRFRQFGGKKGGFASSTGKKASSARSGNQGKGNTKSANAGKRATTGNASARHK